jgi:hypothetical protein
MERSNFSSSHLEGEIIAIVTVGIDLAKNVFAVHGIDESGKAVLTGSFSKLEMGVYFNAIYNADLTYMCHLDDQYLASKKRSMNGGYGNNTIWQKITAAMQLDDASLLIPTVQTYLANYDGVYKRCLRKDAVTFTITSTRKDSYGNVIGQRNTDYTVNQEFEQAFRQTSDTGVSTALQELTNPAADAANGSPIAKIAKGTHEQMAAFPCDGTVINQLEQGLLQMLKSNEREIGASESCGCGARQS